MNTVKISIVVEATGKQGEGKTTMLRYISDSLQKALGPTSYVTFDDNGEPGDPETLKIGFEVPGASSDEAMYRVRPLPDGRIAFTQIRNF